jgi:hypothetical protein
MTIEPVSFRPVDGMPVAYMYFVTAALLPVAAFMAEGFFSGIGSLFVSGILVVVGLRDLGRSTDKRPRLVIDTSGLTAPGFFEKTIPWSAITKLALDSGGMDRGGPGLCFDVSDSQAYGPVDSNQLRTAFDLPGPISQRIAIGELASDSVDVRAAIERFAPERLEPPIVGG